VVCTANTAQPFFETEQSTATVPTNTSKVKQKKGFDSDSTKTSTYLAKHDVFAIEPRRIDGANKELRSIGTGTGIGHA
jgi:hypothetical protein